LEGRAEKIMGAKCPATILRVQKRERESYGEKLKGVRSKMIKDKSISKDTAFKIFQAK